MTRYWPDERIASLRRMYDAGQSYSEMGYVLGVSKVAVLKKVQKLGWPPRAKQGRPGNPGWRKGQFAGVRSSRGFKISAALQERRFAPVTIRRFSWEQEQA